MHEPPDGYEDLLHDSGGDVPRPATSGFRELDVPTVGVVLARPPLPNAAGALAMAANAKIDGMSQLNYLTLMIRNHLAPGELERILVGQMNSQYPADAVQQIARAVCTWGTARPTRRSSRSA